MPLLRLLGCNSKSKGATANLNPIFLAFPIVQGVLSAYLTYLGLPAVASCLRFDALLEWWNAEQIASLKETCADTRSENWNILEPNIEETLTAAEETTSDGKCKDFKGVDSLRPKPTSRSREGGPWRTSTYSTSIHSTCHQCSKV